MSDHEQAILISHLLASRRENGILPARTRKHTAQVSKVTRTARPKGEELLWRGSEVTPRPAISRVL